MRELNQTDDDDGFSSPAADEGSSRALKPHLRPRSMTERVANLLEHSHRTGKVGDLTKSMPSLGETQEDGEEEDEDDDKRSNDEVRKQVVHNGFTYYVWSAKKENSNMEAAESSQRSRGDAFWGLIRCKEDEAENERLMGDEDGLASSLRDAEKTALLHKKWKELDKQSKATMELVKAKKEEKARKDYMHMFMQAKDSSEIINHAWATRPTLLQRGVGGGMGGAATSPAKEAQSNAGFRLNVFGSDDPAVGTGGGAAAAQTFHATQSRARGKKIVNLESKKDHYAQEPFERFSAHKVRVDGATDMMKSASDGSLLGGPRPKLQDRLESVASM